MIFISGGTEGLMKWLSYKKESAKASAAQTKNAPAAALKKMPG